MLAGVAYSVFAVSMSVQLSSTYGYVGDKTTVTGTIVTFNGPYVILFDVAKTGDPASPTCVIVGNGTATGYAISEVITIPNAYKGGDQLFLIDTTAGIPQAVSAFYTVQTKYAVSIDQDYVVEGAPFTATVTITGGANTGGNVDLITRVNDPSGTALETLSQLAVAQSTYGHWEGTFNYPVDPTKYGTDGTYKVYFDYNDGTLHTSVASATVAVRMTNKPTYGRTETVSYRGYVADKVVASIELVWPDGTVHVLASGLALTPWAPAYPTENTWTTTKTTLTGAYTLRYKDADGNVLKSNTFTLNASGINLVLGPEEFWDEWNVPAYDWKDLTVTNTAERMTTVTAEWQLYYDDMATPVTSADLPNGFTVKVLFNSTLVATINVSPLTNFGSPNWWWAKWLVPKDAVLGTGYTFLVEANSISDVNTNIGPADKYNTADEANAFTVTKGLMYVTSAPLNIYPGGGAEFQRTLTAKGTFEIKYRNGDRFTSDEFSKGNATIYQEGTAYEDAALAAANYNSATGLWIAQWKIPYDTPSGMWYAIGAGSDVESEILDKNGNMLAEVLTAPAESEYFNVIPAVITVSGLATDKATYLTAEQITVTFTATYPSGDPVTTGIEGDYPLVVFTNVDDVDVPKVATYTSGVWHVGYIIPTDSLTGSWKVSIATGDVQDDATPANVGPSADKSVSFAVTRISLSDIWNLQQELATKITEVDTKSDAALAAANAAKAASDAATVAINTATTSANAAKAAADAAKAAGDAASAAASAAGTKADAATAAANAAKTAADAASAAAAASGTKTDAISGKLDSLQTLVYAAIGAALIAAIAAIVALMQISRKIA